MEKQQKTKLIFLVGLVVFFIFIFWLLSLKYQFRKIETQGEEQNKFKTFANEIKQPWYDFKNGLKKLFPQKQNPSIQLNEEDLKKIEEKILEQQKKN